MHKWQEGRPMKRSSVVLARYLGFVETFDLSPDGRIFFPELAKALVDRYQFQRFPKEPGDFDEAKGIEFTEGRRGKDVIWRIIIYNFAVLIETRLNTKLSEELLEEALLWASEQFGLSYEPGMIKRRAYVSQLTFYSEATLNLLNPVLERMSERITDAVSEFQKTRIEYQTTTFGIHHDHTTRKAPMAGFIIQPRAETPLEDHKYFSEAPLPTDLHWELLEELESSLLGKGVSTQEITSIISEAAKGVSLWMEHMDSNELRELQKAAEIIKNVKQSALQKQQASIR
jgi:hypothetical protein